jgi:hypothetical protein
VSTRRAIELRCDCQADCKCGTPVFNDGLLAPVAIVDYARNDREIRVIGRRQGWTSSREVSAGRESWSIRDYCPDCSTACRKDES